ncbi:hypothetical protein EJ110_NYTH12585 [Nymphaea thermarum]|nr:hypothetical protein EJ110_NYTH12585 [Nymphaea thermarum]
MISLIAKERLPGIGLECNEIEAQRTGNRSGHGMRYHALLLLVLAAVETYIASILLVLAIVKIQAQDKNQAATARGEFADFVVFYGRQTSLTHRPTFAFVFAVRSSFLSNPRLLTVSEFRRPEAGYASKLLIARSVEFPKGRRGKPIGRGAVTKEAVIVGGVAGVIAGQEAGCCSCQSTVAIAGRALAEQEAVAGGRRAMDAQPKAAAYSALVSDSTTLDDGCSSASQGDKDTSLEKSMTGRPVNSYISQIVDGNVQNCSRQRLMLLDGTAIMYRAYYRILARLHHGHLEHADGNGDWVLTIFSALSSIIAILELTPSHVAGSGSKGSGGIWSTVNAERRWISEQRWTMKDQLQMMKGVK